ncbi:NTF2 domain-containing protein [Rhizobium gallicum]|uniref:NTF2 domain-containing protein n=1 Tax=Rhizobium gallicum TaxID=56730 RepID=A0A1L5NDM2_9HYPH|nr:NTF2 domain-containing protein [Rhizobium gallicum]
MATRRVCWRWSPKTSSGSFRAKNWPLAGTRHGHAGLADLLETASKSIETSTEPREFVAQGDRVLVVGFARGKIKATNKTFEDDWIIAITVRDGRLTSIRE